MKIYGNNVKCDPADEAWITETVGKIPHKHLMVGVLNSYSELYATGEGKTLTQLGAIRRNANTRLRVYVSRLLESQK